MARASRALNLGIIGCGRVTAGLHLPALRHVPEIRVLAVADVEAERAERVADAHAVPGRQTDYRELLQESSIEAVAICTPPSLHAEIALAALDAGKHLFVEKPLALSAADAAGLVERASRSERVAMVGFNLRWHPLIREARRLVAVGALGTINLFRSAITGDAYLRPGTPSWANTRGDGDLWLEQGIHHFDLCRLLLGTEIAEVFALSEPSGDAATASLTTERGVVASTSVSEATHPANEVDLYGTAGRLHLSLLRFDGLAFTPAASVQGDPRTRLRGAVRRLRAVGAGTRHLRNGGVFRASYVRQWAHFADCVRTGAPVEATFEDGRLALDTALAAIESASTGTPADVDSQGLYRD